MVYHWATGCMTGNSSPGRGWEFFLHHRVQTGTGVHPASYPMGSRASYPGGKAAGAEADYSHPSIAKVNNTWSCTFTPNTPSWHVLCLKKAHGLLLYSACCLFCTCVANICIVVVSYDVCLHKLVIKSYIRGRIQKFPDWPHGAIIANGVTLCH
jgi:hypothetical protein